jgi:hypothetical protein
MPAFLDLTGTRVGRIAILKLVLPKGPRPRWECICDCGTKFTAGTSSLRSGRHNSCGCLHREICTKHGQAGKPGQWRTQSRAYRSWQCMKSRCLNENNEAFHHYGGRGITIDPRWIEFTAFIADMGNPPTELHTIERIDNNGNYCKSNCRWATHREQQFNRRNSRIVTFNGEHRAVAEWIQLLGLSEHRIRGRLKAGWDFEEAVTTPALGTKPEPIEMAGKRFGMLTVLEYANNADRLRRWLCRCDCGVEKIIVGKELRNGHTKSCGCNRGRPGVPQRRRK